MRFACVFLVIIQGAATISSQVEGENGLKRTIRQGLIGSGTETSLMGAERAEESHQGTAHDLSKRDIIEQLDNVVIPGSDDANSIDQPSNPISERFPRDTKKGRKNSRSNGKYSGSSESKEHAKRPNKKPSYGGNKKDHSSSSEKENRPNKPSYGGSSGGRPNKPENGNRPQKPSNGENNGNMPNYPEDEDQMPSNGNRTKNSKKARRPREASEHAAIRSFDTVHVQ
ncbi:unnamed protein product [Nippostrongylus brasiliensis]|uniref:Secreted protein n=1 Tax=Nippostrongylus brasiliensis TaxID=27835 RepID=A0A0N4XR80_NIPBR|nr:unnamed protein product [Nippostrongylus brasiliensis]